MDCNGDQRNKRARDDSDVDSPALKLQRCGSDGDSPGPADEVVDSGLDSPESRRIRGDLLDILDSPDTAGEREPMVRDLDSVIRSFEEEIRALPLPPASSAAADDSSGETGESPPALGYLLEASDDALGLPPGFSDVEDATNVPVDLPGMRYDSFGFEDEIPGYDSFGFGAVGEPDSSGDSNDEPEFVALGGLFDYSDPGYNPPDFPRQPETLPAV